MNHTLYLSFPFTAHFFPGLERRKGQTLHGARSVSLGQPGLPAGRCCPSRCAMFPHLPAAIDRALGARLDHCAAIHRSMPQQGDRLGKEATRSRRAGGVVNGPGSRYYEEQTVLDR